MLILLSIFHQLQSIKPGLVQTIYDGEDLVHRLLVRRKRLSQIEKETQIHSVKLYHDKTKYNMTRLGHISQNNQPP